MYCKCCVYSNNIWFPSANTLSYIFVVFYYLLRYFLAKNNVLIPLLFKYTVTNLQKYIKCSFCVPNRRESIISIKYLYTLIGKERDKLYETMPQIMLNFL